MLHKPVDGSHLADFKCLHLHVVLSPPHTHYARARRGLWSLDCWQRQVVSLAQQEVIIYCLSFDPIMLCRGADYKYLELFNNFLRLAFHMCMFVCKVDLRWPVGRLGHGLKPSSSKISHWHNWTLTNPHSASGSQTSDLPLSRRTPQPLDQRSSLLHALDRYICSLLCSTVTLWYFMPELSHVFLPLIRLSCDEHCSHRHKNCENCYSLYIV